jgi:hypothetical protein
MAAKNVGLANHVGAAFRPPGNRLPENYFPQGKSGRGIIFLLSQKPRKNESPSLQKPRNNKL